MTVMSPMASPVGLQNWAQTKRTSSWSLKMKGVVWERRTLSSWCRRLRATGWSWGVQRHIFPTTHSDPFDKKPQWKMRNFKASAMVSLRWVSLLENRNFQKERYKVRGHVPCDGSESIIKTCKHTSHPVNQTHESKIIYCQVRTMAGFSVQSLSRVWLFATPWITVWQASLSISNSWSLP